MSAQQASEIGRAAAREVRIHIDQKPYESPTPTTGRALYALASIPNGHQLYREVQGDEEDEPIENGDEVVELVKDEHFHSAREAHHGLKIFVNSREEVVPKKHVSYDQIVKLAYPTPPDGQDPMYLVTYSKGPRANPSGTLVEGQKVKVKNGMIFNVKVTNRS
jgi:Multiubiquitin